MRPAAFAYLAFGAGIVAAFGWLCVYAARHDGPAEARCDWLEQRVDQLQAELDRQDLARLLNEIEPTQATYRPPKPHHN